MREVFPAADIYSMYGLTEAFRSTYLEPALLDAHPDSMGSAIPFAEIMVVDADGAARREEGELVHAGPLVAKGYWQDPERTAERFKPAPAGSAYGGMAVWSGDRVRRDEDGLLYFVGREDGMIKTVGQPGQPDRGRGGGDRLGPGRRGGRARLSRRAARRGDRPGRPPGPPRRGGGAARLPQARSCPISCSPARSSGATSCRAAPTASSTGSRSRAS